MNIAQADKQPRSDQWLPATKLSPDELPNDVIDRPQLVSALHEAVRSHRLTLLSAPLGYGKSTLLHQWTEALLEYSGNQSMDVAWLSLDASENDRTQFLLALVGALQTLHPRCGQRAIAFLTREGYPAPIDATTMSHVISGLIIIDIMQYLPEPFALVLDSYERITETSAHDALDYLVRRLPHHARLVVSTTQDPPLSLARLHAYRLAIEFRAPDLAFSEEEIAVYVRNLLGEDLSDAQMAALSGCTEGWPAGVAAVTQELQRLCSSTARGRYLSDSYGIFGSGANPQALDALFYQTGLRDLSTPLRRFLLQTSILTVLDAERCAAVSECNDAGDFLEEIYRRNLFMIRHDTFSPDGSAPSDGANRQRWRYHRMFATFLRGWLAREMPDQLAALHCRAAQVEIEPAARVYHQMAANQWHEAVQTILKVSRESVSAQVDTAPVCRWIARLPEAIRRQYPDLQEFSQDQGVPEELQRLGLTERQYEVLSLIATGATNREIADELVVTLPTVKGHISQILRKLQVDSRHAAVRRAAELYILHR